MGNGLKELRKERGWTQESAADAMGLSKSQFIKLERGERGLTERTIGLAAKAFEVSKSRVIGDATVSEVEPPQGSPLLAAGADIRPVHVQGIVEAGAFRETRYLEGAPLELVAAPPDRDFPFARQVAFKIAGDSMNAARPQPLLEGSYVVCLDFDDLEGRVPIRSGMKVVVERVEGELREWTIKEVEKTAGGYILHPRSNNPIHKPTVIGEDFNTDSGVEIRVLAWVRFVFAREPV